MILRQETYYSQDDPECYEDYYGIALFDEMGEKIVEYGDHYHDKGEEKMEGFLDGMRYMTDEIICVEKINLAIK